MGIKPTAWTGGSLVVEDARLEVGEVMARHPDRSITVICSSMHGKYLARIFTKQPAMASDLETTRIGVSRGVRPYEMIGQAKVEYGPPENGKVERGWATVRGFTDRTLQHLLARPDIVRDQPELTLRIALDVAYGIRALHRRQLVHGDLRPSNVLLDRAESARVVDYGITRHPDSVRPSDESVRYRAPEELLQDGPTQTGDVYSYGKLVRALTRASGGLASDQRRLLDWLIFECVRTAPADRPDMKEVVAILEDATIPEDEDAYKRLAPAILADMDGRVPDLLEHHLRSCLRAATEAASAVALDSHRFSLYRIHGLREPELIHLLSTLALAKLPKRLKLPAATANYVILDSMENVRHEQNYDWGKERIDTPYLDPDWREELVSLTLHGRTPEETDEWQRGQIRRQLEAAARLTESVLESDTFVRSEDVAAIMSRSCPGITVEEVRMLREMGYLLSMPYRGANLYPMFQFQSNSGLPFDCVKRVADVQRTQDSTWRRSIWWFLGSPALGGMSPAQWLRARRPESDVINTFTHTDVA